MDFKTPERRNFKTSRQFQERFPVKKCNLLNLYRNDFNLGKKFREIDDRENRIFHWELSNSQRKEHENQQMKKQSRENRILRPIKYRQHLLPSQWNRPVRVNVSYLNLPQSFFSNASLGITPRNINDTEKTIASKFLPQMTSTPLSHDGFFTNIGDFISGKSSSLQSYARFISSIQIPVNKSKEKLFLNDITDGILTSLRKTNRSSIPAPQSNQELNRIETAEILSQKQTKLKFLRKGRNKKLQNSYSTFTLNKENSQEPNAEFVDHTNIFQRKETSASDFTFSPFWFQQAAVPPVSNSNSQLGINNQLTNDLRQNLGMNEILSDITNTSTSYCRDQYFNFEWKNEDFSSLDRKSNYEDFSTYDRLLQNLDCKTSKSPSIFSTQKDLNLFVHYDNDDVTSQLAFTESRFSEGNMKRRKDPEHVLDETNISWERALLDESVQTNSSEVIRYIDHLITQSPDVKSKKFSIYEKSKWN